MKTIEEIIGHYRAEPAPLLPILHAIQEREGYLSKEAIQAVSEELRIPHSELYGTITFYHYFRTEKAEPKTLLCDGPACRLQKDWKGLQDKLNQEGHAKSVPCHGRCDMALTSLTEGFECRDISTAGPLPPENPDGTDRECLFKHIRDPKRRTLKGYEATGGYQALKQCLKGGTPEQTIKILKDSGLAGRGGAAFPTGAKWEMVGNEKRTPKYIIANADEGEPGCFKDRALMEHDPHALIEGMAVAGWCVGAKIGIVYLRYEYPHCVPILEQAIREAEGAGYLKHIKIYIRRGAGAYICGEETSLLNSLEGKRPFPREKPPFPTTHGFMQMPTVINNVETLCAVPPILVQGAEWYKGLGLNGNAGTKIFCVSGDVNRPGNYEVPIGTPLRTLIDRHAGGMKDGKKFKAATMAGISGGFLSAEHLDVALDGKSVAAAGSMLGSGGIIVYHEGRNMVEAARNCMAFFADESCGKCFPCRIGSTRLTEILNDALKGGSGRDCESEMKDIGRVMMKMSACGLGLAAPLVVQSLMKHWKEEL